MDIVTNKPVPRRYEEKISQISKSEEILFVVVGDLNLKAKYAESALVFTKNGITKIPATTTAIFVTSKVQKLIEAIIHSSKASMIAATNAIINNKSKNFTRDTLNFLPQW